jgi:hypothetical protein
VEDVSLDVKKNAPKSTCGTHGGRGTHCGRRSGAGRKKGVPNKLSADVKAAIMEAFNEAGGAKYLRKVARSDPRTFCSLLAKVLLAQVTGDSNDPIRPYDRIEVVFVDPKEQPSPTAEVCAGGKTPTQLSSRGDDARPAMRIRDRSEPRSGARTDVSKLNKLERRVCHGN